MIEFLKCLGVSQKLNTELANFPGDLLLATFQRKLKACVSTKSCTQILLAALFKISSNCNHMSWADECIYIMEWNSGTSYNMDKAWIKYLMLSERKKTYKITGHPRRRLEDLLCMWEAQLEPFPEHHEWSKTFSQLSSHILPARLHLQCHKGVYLRRKKNKELLQYVANGPKLLCLNWPSLLVLKLVITVKYW